LVSQAVAASSAEWSWDRPPFSVALAMRHRLSGISNYGLNGLGKGDEHPAQAPSGVLRPLVPFTHSNRWDIIRHNNWLEK